MIWDENPVVLDESDCYANPFDGDMTLLDLTNGRLLVRSPFDAYATSLLTRKLNLS
jgi:hypothetical protein